jgi:hypothetical protein
MVAGQMISWRSGGAADAWPARASASPFGIAAQHTSATTVIEIARSTQTPVIRLRLTLLAFAPLSPDAD